MKTENLTMPKQRKNNLLRKLLQKTVVVGTTLTSLLFSLVPATFAEIESSKVYTPRYCKIYSSLINSYFSCEKYLFTYSTDNYTTAHHFIVKQSGNKIDEIMLFSPDSISESLIGRESFNFKITQMLIILQTQNQEPLYVEGDGRCFITITGISCSFEDYKLGKSLTVKVDF